MEISLAVLELREARRKLETAISDAIRDPLTSFQKKHNVGITSVYVEMIDVSTKDGIPNEKLLNKVNITIVL